MAEVWGVGTRVCAVIRRVPAAVACFALAAVLATGCNTFRKTSEAASLAKTKTEPKRSLSVDDFQRIAEDLNPSASKLGVVAGVEARSVISRWIVSELAAPALSAKGLDVTAQDVDDAKAGLAASEDGWSGFSAATQSMLIAERAPQAAVYNAGVQKSGVFCVKLLSFKDAAKATAASKDLANGSKTIDQVAAENNQADTVVKDPNTAEDCAEASSAPLAATVVTALASLPIGQPTQPVTDSGTTYIAVQRPYAEVAASLDTLFRGGVTGLANQQAANEKITVNSRIGMWDPTSGTVIATR